MPCTDSGPREPSTQERQDAHNVPAMLCALLTVLEGQGTLEEVLASVDWKEAGVSLPWLRYWWEKHQDEDRERRAQEAEVHRRVAARQAALAKLTPEERKLLSL